jgi:hypothetical protein
VSLSSVPVVVLAILGAGFFIANVRIALDYSRFLQRRGGALLTWRPPPSRYVAMSVGIAIALGVLILFTVFRLHTQAFGETMMFAYYAYLLPLSGKIARGFYADGIWADSAFVPYDEVGGLTWREGERSATLIIVSRLRNLARRLAVPGDKYASARRLITEKIADRRIRLRGTGLGLADSDEPGTS